MGVGDEINETTIVYATMGYLLFLGELFTEKTILKWKRISYTLTFWSGKRDDGPDNTFYTQVGKRLPNECSYTDVCTSRYASYSTEEDFIAFVKGSRCAVGYCA